MSKTESRVIAVFLSIACPLTVFVIAWWVSFALPIPKKAIPPCALGSLGLGIIIIILRLRRWVREFYAVSLVLAVPLYLFWCAIALAFFMGLPVGVVVLGLLAGLHVGRKGRHGDTQLAVFQKDALNVALFTAAVTGLVSLAMGLLAIQEKRTMQHVLSLFGVSHLADTPGGRVALVAIAVPVLIGLQYWLTRTTARWGFKLGRNSDRSGGSIFDRGV